MSALEKFVTSTHADELPAGEFFDEWEPENKYVETLRELRFRPVIRGSYSARVIATPRSSTDLEGCMVFTASSQESRQEVVAVNLTQDKPVESVQAELAKCIAARPHESIKLISGLGILTFLFTLAVYFVGRVLIVNPVFAFFGVLACALFWAMAALDRRLYHR